MHAHMPLKWIGPIKLVDEDCCPIDVEVPLATFESTLWPSTNRGAKISRLTDGIHVTLVDNQMTRSVILQAKQAREAKAVKAALPALFHPMNAIVQTTSRFATLIDVHVEIVGYLLYLRFAFHTGEASGHNMATKASDALITFLCEQFPSLHYVSISANVCTDKKVSAINGILGRGKYVIAEMWLSEALCVKHLRTTPKAITLLNTKKNLLGSILAGSVRCANAHFANILLGMYLATGQDAANIVEGSQGITYCEVQDSGDLYFSVTLPNVIVGTIGHGKDLDFVKSNRARLGNPNAVMLAKMIAATVLCAELSLMAAQTCFGELTQSHLLFERQT